jgi:hypothetical protein
LTIRSHRRSQFFGAVALAWMVCVAVPVAAAELRTARFSGSLVGFVRGPAGDAQMGATVYLLNKYGGLLHQTLTNERGAFGFDALHPDLYTVRVLQTSFAPVSKTGVSVIAGERAFLSVQLASLVSSIELVPPTAAMASLMSEDWKWVLRGALATRPVLRFLPDFDSGASTAQSPRRQEVFTETRGMFALIAGETGSARSASISDMGTAFALSTAVFGTNHVSLSGNVGYSPANGVPAAAFRTSYRRQADADAQFNPEVFLSIQQVFLPTATPQRFAGNHMAAASSMSTGIADELRVTDFLWAKVGVSLDSVTYGSRLSYFSPYALTTLALGDLGVVEFGFSSGIPPAGLSQSQRTLSRETVGDLHQDVNSLAMMPRITVRDGTARVQRSENYEVSYSKNFGSRAITAGYYREGLSNAALTMASPDGFVPAGDVVADFNSNSGVFNIGDLSRTGVAVAASQGFGDAVTLAMIFSRGGVLRTDQTSLAGDDPNEIRGAIRRSTQNAISARVAGRAPVLGTLYAASYQWTDFRALTPGHLFLTNLSSPDVGLNVSVRQSLPAPPFLSGRMEISAEMRNLLAQGYLPLRTQAGQRLQLIHSPRAVRGGVAFIF